MSYFNQGDPVLEGRKVVVKKCGEIAPHILERKYGDPACNLPLGHEGTHRSDGDRWELVIDYDEIDTLP